MKKSKIVFVKTSKFVRVDKDVIIEYIYDSEGFLLEGYGVITNLKDNYNQFYSTEGSITRNTLQNNIFRLDPVKNIWTGIDFTKYGFLGNRDYGTSIPLRFDKIRVHLPVNFTFGGNFGYHLRVYTLSQGRSEKPYILSDFFFDITNTSQSQYLAFNSPPLLIAEKLWQKNIEILVPSTYFISNQRTTGLPTEFSLNYNLTDGIGISLTSPIFIEFSFITQKQSILGETRYTLGGVSQVSIPQTPEFENLSVIVEPSPSGDFFEIYGIYNNTVAEFVKFIDDAKYTGKKYNVEYTLTLFEQNVRTRTQKIYIDEFFDQKVEYRPIIRSSTTTAVIECEMQLINLVDFSIISRKSSYGMLPDEVAKYSLSLTKINLDNANKPKIFAIKNQLGAGILELNDRRNGSSRRGDGDPQGNSQIKLEFIKVPFPLFIDKFNLVSKSDSVEVGREIFYSDGALRLIIYPFDNIIKFVIAQRVSDSQIEYLDLSNSSDVRLVFKSDVQTVSFPMWDGNSGAIDLERGTISFLVAASRISDIQRIFETGRRVFYITTTNNQITTPIFSGVFTLFDSTDYIEELLVRNRAEEPVIDVSSEGEEIVVAVPENNLTISATGTSDISSAPEELGANTLQNFGNSDQILLDTNIPPGSILGSMVNLYYRNNLSQDTTKPQLIYKIITSQEESEVLLNISVDDLIYNKSKYSVLDFEKNKIIGKALIFPDTNSLVSTDISNPGFNQTIEFAIFIPSGGIGNTLNLFPKAIKLNNNNLFVTITTWNVVKTTQDTQGKLFKFSLILKPTDKLEIYIDFEPGDSSSLTGFTGLATDNVINVSKNETITYKGRVTNLLHKLTNTLASPVIANELRTSLRVLSDEVQRGIFNRVLNLLIDDMKRRGLYVLDYPCSEIKFQKILLLLELSGQELKNLEKESKSCSPTDKECVNTINRKRLSWIEIIIQTQNYSSLCT